MLMCNKIEERKQITMKTLKYLGRTIGLALLACWAPNGAQAAFADYRIDWGGLEYFTLQVTDYRGGAQFSALAGGIAIDRTAGSTRAPSTYLTVCTDIGGNLWLGGTYGYAEPIAFSGQSGLNPTWGAGNEGSTRGTPNIEANAAAAIQNAAQLFYTHYTELTGVRNGNVTARAALQLAVWDALYDSTAGLNTLGLGNGRFQATGTDQAAIDLANLWLGQLTGNYSWTGNLLMPSPTDPLNNNGEPAQELLMRTQDFSPVPEPTTLFAGAGALGLFLLGAGARSRRSGVIRIGK
jgi:hypothetical protein